MKLKFFLIISLFLIFWTLSASSGDAAAMKQIQYFVGQETVLHNPGDQIDMPFSIFLGEISPGIKNAEIEIKGVAINQITPNPTIQVSIDDPTFVQSRAKTFVLDSVQRTDPFKIRYDATSYLASVINEGGNWSFTLNLKLDGAAASLLSAKIRLTYTFLPKFLTSGQLDSSTYDTQVPEGAGYNAIMWKGQLPATSRVQFQFATSNDPDGPWPSSFAGPDGLPTSYYEPSGPDIPIRISPAYHNNMRYFRYRIILKPSNSGLASPRVDDVIINWSP